jgi:hypothetical protein
MALQNPAAVYYAKSNTEAQLICHMLHQSGIEAYVMEDYSPAAYWLGATNTTIHNPRVWVDRSNVDSALTILKEHDRLTAERRTPGLNEDEGPSEVSAICEECGRESTFSAAQRGSVQDCPACGRYMDVGDDDEEDGSWGDAELDP